MAVKCSVKGCERGAVFVLAEIGLCPEHFRPVVQLVQAVQSAGAGLVAPPPSPPAPAAEEAARPVRIRRVLRTDGEIEEVIFRRLGRSGIVRVRGLVGEFAIDRAGYRSATERCLALMARMVERDPDRLELVGSGKEAVLRVKRPPAAAPEGQP